MSKSAVSSCCVVVAVPPLILLPAFISYIEPFDKVILIRLFVSVPLVSINRDKVVADGVATILK